MSSQHRHFAVLLTLMLAGGAPALAQDAAAAADWDLTLKPEDRLTAAHTLYDNGLLLAARCQAGVFQVMIGGLPEAPPARDLATNRRLLGIGFGEEPVADQGFLMGANRQFAFAEMPAPLARSMREGGAMQIVVAGAAENGRNLRHVIDLPRSNTAIDQALASCGRPLVDPRDAELEGLEDDGLPKNITWRKMPQPQYPAGRAYSSGLAVVSCLARPDGRVTDCVAETEVPANSGFGAAVVRAARQGRLENLDGGPIPLTRIVYRTYFHLEGASDETTGTRIRLPGNE